MCVASAVLLAASAAASACPNYAKVASFRGYVLVDFHKTVSEANGSGGTETVTLDHSTGVMHFGKVAPLYIHAGPPGHRKKILIGFRGRKAKGVMTVDDSYSNGSVSGTQTADGHPGSRVTLGFNPFGCTAGVIMSFEISTKAGGSWPYGPGDFHPERGSLILAASPARSIPGSLKLSGTATVPLVNGATPTTGYFDTWAPDGSWGAWENAFANIAHDTGQPTPTASIQWGFTPNKK